MRKESRLLDKKTEALNLSQVKEVAEIEDSVNVVAAKTYREVQ